METRTIEFFLQEQIYYKTNDMIYLGLSSINICITTSNQQLPKKLV